MRTFSRSSAFLLASLFMCLLHESATPEVTFYPFVPGSTLTVGKPGLTLGDSPALDTMRQAIKKTKPRAYSVTLRDEAYEPDALSVPQDGHLMTLIITNNPSCSLQGS